MISLHKQSFGNTNLIHITGNNKKEIEYEYYGFVNNGCGSKELKWVNEEKPFEATFWATDEELKECLTNRELMRMLYKMDTKIKKEIGATEISPRFIDLAKILGEKRAAAIPSVSTKIDYLFNQSCFNVEVKEVAS